VCGQTSVMYTLQKQPRSSCKANRGVQSRNAVQKCSQRLAALAVSVLNWVSSCKADRDQRPLQLAGECSGEQR
jgi:hypothetical protein